jgi:ribosomal protein S18 acetylase RimI-like enzyme
LSFILRPYAASDFGELLALDHACYPPGIAYSKIMFRWYLNAPGAICLVSEGDAGEVPGFILAESDPPNGHIITLDVAEKARRRGLGTKLTVAVEAELSAHGVANIELETATDNAAGVAFWMRHGYRTVGVIPRYYLDRIDAYHMVKTLDAPKET